MSWSDPCSYCGTHRADCDCGHWGEQRPKEDSEKIKLIRWLQNLSTKEFFMSSPQELTDKYNKK